MSGAILVGLDIGTSGVRAVAFSLDGAALAEGRASMTLTYPSVGRAEQSPSEWRRASEDALRQLAARLGDAVRRVAGIGLTGQCPTFAFLHPDGVASPWGWSYQDNRATAESDRLAALFGEDAVHRRTGQRPNPFYVAPKLLWLQRHESGTARAGSAVVQPRDYVGWCLTGELATDPTHAACTLLYDIGKGEWASDWIGQLGLDAFAWPRIAEPCSILGHLTEAASAATGIPPCVPVAVGAADSLCAIYGAQGLERETVCDVSGTSTCLHVTLDEPLGSPAVNMYPHVEAGVLCAEAGLNTTGIALKWVSELTGQSFAELYRAADLVPPGAEGLIFLPHLSGGERDCPERTGAFVGLHLSHGGGHLFRAALEGIAFGIRDRIEQLRGAGCRIERIVVSGGGASDPLWNQIKADITGLDVIVPDPADTTAFGAALALAKALGIEASREGQSRIAFRPDRARTEGYEPLYRRFLELERMMMTSKTGEAAHGRA